MKVIQLMKNEASLQNLSNFDNKSLLIVDDDNPFRERLSRAMEKKGFLVQEAKTVAQSIEIVRKNPPNFAVVDAASWVLIAQYGGWNRLMLVLGAVALGRSEPTAVEPARSNALTPIPTGTAAAPPTALSPAAATPPTASAASFANRAAPIAASPWPETGTP